MRDSMIPQGIHPTTYIIALVIGAIATAILLTYTLMRVSRKTILVCLVIINTLWGVHYFMLEAYTGAFCQLFTALVVLICTFKGKNKFFSGLAVPIIINMIYLMIAAFTWDGFPTVVQIVGNFIFVLATWSDKELAIKALFIPLGLLWLLYNILCYSWIGIVCQVLAVTFNVVFVTKYLLQKRKEKNA